MASLTGQTISSTYDSLLKVTDNGPLNSSLKTITDGLGNSSSLQLSTVAAYITGGLTVTGQLTLPGAYDLTVNGFTIGKGPGALNNTVYGFQSLLSNTTGVFNTANGYQALYNNTIGEYNTAFGLQSMFSNVAGGNNVGIGANALPSNTSGNNNTAIGRYAGFGTGTNNNITGSNNIFIGYQSVGISSSESNRTWIGNSSTLATWVGGNLLVGGTTNNGFGLEVTGTAKISGQITLGSTITNGTYTYTLPSATGTLALTSALSGYLPLTGGTLSTTNTSETLRIVNGGTGYGLYVQSNSYFQGDATFQSVANSLLKTVSGLLTAAVAGTDYLTPTGSGAGLSGVVLTTTNQSIAGLKTFNNGISASTTSGNAISSTCSATGGLAFYGQSSAGIGAQFESGASGEAALIAKHTNSGPLQYWMTSSGVVATMSNAGALTIAGQLSLGSTITNGTYTYTLPSATGTLALTSALSSYLPLSGGTLSGTLTLGNGELQSSTTLKLGANATTIYLRPNGANNSTGQVSIDNTGALSGTSATFSSSVALGKTISTVTTNGILYHSTNNNLYIQGGSDGLAMYSDGSRSNASIVLDVASNTINFGTSGSTRLTIASTGAATFSSSVTASSSIISTTAFGGTFTATDGTNQVRFGSYFNTIGSGNSYDGVIYTTHASSALYLMTGGSTTPKVTITSGGNVLIGGTTNNNGNISINSTNPVLSFGTSSSGPDTALVGTAGGANYHISGSATGDFCIRPIATGNLLFGTSASAGAASSERMRITSTGNVLIGTSTDNGYKTQIINSSYGLYIAAGSTSSHYPVNIESSSFAALFRVRGDALVSFPQINNFTTGNSPNTWINPSSSYGIYINTSSRRYKKEISNYDKGIDIVNQLRPVYYKGISEVDGDKQFVGLIAEEIHDLGLTEFVNYNEEGLPNSLSYPNMIALAFKAIQEQQAQIEELKALIK